LTRKQVDLGRGAIFIPLAKLWFVFVSFLINFGLPNLLDADGVGDYGVVNRFVSLINMVMIAGTIQSVSKFISEDPTRISAMRRWALRAQAIFATSVSILYFLFAAPLANLLNDPGLTNYFRISAVIPLFYAFYAVHIGVFNGSKDFLKQAAFDVGYAALRAVGILSAAALGYGVGGVFVAFAAAAAVIMFLSSLVDRDGREAGAVDAPATLDAHPTTDARPTLDVRPTVDERPTLGVNTRDVTRFALPVMALVLVTQWLLSFDLFWVKALSPDAESSLLSGAYFAMLNLALVPYMLVLSINFIVFPLISRSTFDEDADTTRGYIRQSLRIALLTALMLEIVVFASPEAALGMVYPTKPEYLEYAGALRLLAPGYVCLCVLGVMTALLNGAGRPLVSLLGGALTLTLQGVLCYAWVRTDGLAGAATASSVAFAIGTGLVALYVLRRYGAWIAPWTLVRSGIAAASGIAVGSWLEWTGPLFLAEAAVTAVVFLVALVILREIDRRDLDHLMTLARPR